MKRVLIFIFCISMIILTNCNHPTTGTSGSEVPTETITGTIHHINLEGGFWGIIGDDGTKYNPVNLPPEYQKEGLRVEITAEKIEKGVSIQMWGQMIRILKIKQISR